MYSNIAEFYNRYTADIDYNKIADYLEKIFRKFGLPKRSDNGNTPMILDVACGTGELTCILAKRGYEMIGLDVSDEMLTEARDKAMSEDLDILWLCQNMCKMDMYGTVSAMVCVTDGINHLLSEKELNSFFVRIKNFIDDGGLVVFDALSEKYFRDIVGNNTFYDDGEDGTCIWTSRYSEKTKMCKYNITFFESCDDEGLLYERYDDLVREKVWQDDDFIKTSAASGFTTEAIFDGMTFNPANKDSLRKFFVLRK